MLNVGAGTVIGLAYWTVTARVFDERDVGLAVALLAAMRLLAAVTAFGFVGTLTRFIPQTGRRTGRFILLIYAAGTGSAVAACMFFLLTLSHWGDTYGMLSGFGAGLVFTAMVAVWSICTLQEVVLTALRKATLVPVANLVFWLARFGILVAAALLIASGGEAVSWTVFLAWIGPGVA